VSRRTTVAPSHSNSISSRTVFPERTVSRKLAARTSYESPIPPRLFERLTQASLLCQGEVDSDTLIRASAILAKLWRDVDEGDDPSEAQRLVEVADRLEISLIVSAGIVDFASTMRRIRDLPDRDRKFLAMTRLIGLLARQGGYIG
jgi:hypothetical protein